MSKSINVGLYTHAITPHGIMGENMVFRAYMCYNNIGIVQPFMYRLGATYGYTLGQRAVHKESYVKLRYRGHQLG